MADNRTTKKNTNLLVSILAVLVLATTSSILLLTAFVTWLAEVIGSLTLALIITGAAMALAAWVCYKLTLSSPLKHLRDEYEKFMAIISLVKFGYDCARKRISDLFLLFK
ncbi:MAG: hypothetical protein SNH94_01110 [Rikenellaceae bacterium]